MKRKITSTLVLLLMTVFATAQIVLLPGDYADPTVYQGWQYPHEWQTECMCLESPKLNYRDGSPSPMVWMYQPSIIITTMVLWPCVPAFIQQVQDRLNSDILNMNQ